LLFHWPAAHGRAANSIVRRRGAWYEEWLYQPDKVKKWVSWLIEVREDGPGEPAVGRGRFRTLHVAPDLLAGEKEEGQRFRASARSSPGWPIANRPQVKQPPHN
jgi:hypothetical protein